MQKVKKLTSDIETRDLTIDNLSNRIAQKKSDPSNKETELRKKDSIIKAKDNELKKVETEKRELENLARFVQVLGQEFWCSNFKVLIYSYHYDIFFLKKIFVVVVLNFQQAKTGT